MLLLLSNGTNLFLSLDADFIGGAVVLTVPFRALPCVNPYFPTTPIEIEWACSDFCIVYILSRAACYCIEFRIIERVVYKSRHWDRQTLPEIQSETSIQDSYWLEHLIFAQVCTADKSAESLSREPIFSLSRFDWFLGRFPLPLLSSGIMMRYIKQSTLNRT